MTSSGMFKRGFFTELFRRDGRINRAEFAITYFVFAIVALISVLLALAVVGFSMGAYQAMQGLKEPEINIGVIFVVVLIAESPSIWVIFQAHAKRSRDMGKNANLAWLIFVPLANIVIFVQCLAIRGIETGSST